MDVATRLCAGVRVNEKLGKSLIIRPDMYIGFINDKVDMVLMDNYLQNIAGIKL